MLTTLMKLGGKNEFLAISYIVVGAVSIVFGLLIFFKNKKIKRQFKSYHICDDSEDCGRNIWGV